MLLVLHDLLLLCKISAFDFHLDRVSHLEEKFMKLFSSWLKGIIAQLRSATVVVVLSSELSKTTAE
jgi:hypothetical protein